MNTTYLREFIAVAETKSFDKAAEALYISQSNLSKHIRRLEEQFGVVLFDRNSRHVDLSAAGAVLLPVAKKIIAAEQQLERSLSAYKNDQHSILRLGAIANIAAYRLGSLFQKYQEEYPDHYLNMRGGAPQDNYQQLLSGERELAFLRYDKRTDMSKFAVIPFTKDRLVAVCTKEHPIARHESVAITELKNEHILSFAEGSFMHDFIKDAFERANITPHIVMSAHRTDNLLYLTSYQMGICLLMRRPALTVIGDNLTLVDITPPIENRVDLCYLKATVLSRPAEDFIRCFNHWLGEEASDLKM